MVSVVVFGVFYGMSLETDSARGPSVSGGDGVGGLAVPLSRLSQAMKSGADADEDAANALPDSGNDDSDTLSDEKAVAEAERIGLPDDVHYGAPPLSFTSYTVKPGDNIWTLCSHVFGLNRGTIFSVNGIKEAKALQIGEVLHVPNQDGLYYTVKKGDTLDGIVKRFSGDGDDVSIKDISNANELFASVIIPGQRLFIPGATMDDLMERGITGDIFYWPVPSHHITSPYGRRRNPFTRTGYEFHAGIDIRAPMGTPVRAPMAGRVVETGSAIGHSYRSRIYGNYVVIRHNSEYTTLYGHLSRILVRVGQHVNVGTLIGKSGMTGRANGPHLHFTVYKNGRTVNPVYLMGR
jgi:LysM repeat protein